jgi:hypothetical protein
MDCRRSRLEVMKEIERKAGTEIPLPQRRLYLSASKEANSADVIKFGVCSPYFGAGRKRNTLPGILYLVTLTLFTCLLSQKKFHVIPEFSQYKFTLPRFLSSCREWRLCGARAPLSSEPRIDYFPPQFFSVFFNCIFS